MTARGEGEWPKRTQRGAKQGCVEVCEEEISIRTLSSPSPREARAGRGLGSADFRARDGVQLHGPLCPSRLCGPKSAHLGTTETRWTQRSDSRFQSANLGSSTSLPGSIAGGRKRCRRCALPPQYKRGGARFVPRRQSAAATALSHARETLKTSMPARSKSPFLLFRFGFFRAIPAEPSELNPPAKPH